MTASAAAAWFVSLVRAFVAWAYTGIVATPPPLTPSHGWLLPAPVPLPIRK